MTAVFERSFRIVLALALVLGVGRAASAQAPLSLREAVQLGLERGPSAQAARARMQQASAQRRQARARLYPHLGADATFRHYNREIVGPPGSGAVIQAQDEWRLAGTLQQTLFSWDQIAQLRVGEEGERAATAEADGTRADLALSVALAFLDVVRAEALAQAAQQSQEIEADRVAHVDKRVQLGAERNLALLRARTDLAARDQDLYLARQATASAREVLAVLIGERARAPVQAPELHQRALPADVASAFSQASQQSPLLRAARARGLVARAQRRAAVAPWLPRVALDGQLRGTNSTGFLKDEVTWYVGVVASWAIWDGGERGHGIDVAEAAASQAEAEAADAERGVERALAQLLSAARTSRGNLALSRRRLELSEASAKEALSSYDAGLATELDLRTAHGQVAVARAQLAGDTAQAELDAARLFHQLGVLERAVAPGEGPR